MTHKPTEIGPIQQRLINRANDSTAKMVMPGGYQEMRAARKLVRRGVFEQYGALPFFFLKGAKS